MLSIIIIASAVELPFILLLTQGAHSTAGGFGMLFFAPAFSVVSLVSIEHTPFTAILMCQVILTSIPVFWIFTGRRRSPVATVSRVLAYMVLLLAAPGLLAAYERHQSERENAIKTTASNGVVASLEAVNESLALYKKNMANIPRRWRI
jgi:hypothetical protein